MRLTDKKALVTGAGSGLGREISLAFAREGADVAVNDLAAGPAEATAQAVRDLGRTSCVAMADVSDSAAVRTMVEKTVDELGTIDILVNNAGILHMPDGVQERTEQFIQEMMTSGDSTVQVLATQSLEDADWDRMLAIHLNGTFYCTRETLKIMEPKRSGRIINIASIAGSAGIVGVPHYCAAKGGILAFTKSVAREVVRSGITVNAIAPGYVDTPLLEPVSQMMLLATMTQIPMGRFGTPNEIAEAAVFLASDDASYMVGQVVSPNGGQVT